MNNTLLALSGLLLMAAPAAVQAQFDYVTNADGFSLTITHYTGTGGAVDIPTNIAGLPVFSIGDDAFSDALAVTSVTIPDGVLSLGVGAFAFCGGLTSVTIPTSVLSIGNGVFWGCSSLASVAIPNSVSNIAESLFYDCASLTNVTIPSTITDIGADAFYDCASLTNIAIPASVTSIESYAFAGCTNLAGVYFAGNAPSGNSTVFSSDNNVTIYIVPGATGWGSTFGGRPTSGGGGGTGTLLIQASGTNFGVQNHQFGFNITGKTNLVVQVEASPSLDLPVWTNLQTLTLSNGSAFFSDTQWTNFTARYYRISSP